MMFCFGMQPVYVFRCVLDFISSRKRGEEEEECHVLFLSRRRLVSWVDAITSLLAYIGFFVIFFFRTDHLNAAAIAV